MTHKYFPVSRHYCIHELAHWDLVNIYFIPSFFEFRWRKYNFSKLTNFVRRHAFV